MDSRRLEEVPRALLIDLSTRRVEIAGLAKRANGFWMSQVARNLNDAAEGFLLGKRYLIHDRDPLFTAEFLETLGARLIIEEEPQASSMEAIQCRQRLGGMLNYYYRQAA